MLYNMCHVMLYNLCHVMLYNMCHVMLYNMCHVMLYNMCHVMLYNMCHIPIFDIFGYLKNTHKNRKFGKVRQVPTREFPFPCVMLCYIT